MDPLLVSRQSRILTRRRRRRSGDRLDGSPGSAPSTVNDRSNRARGSSGGPARHDGSRLGSHAHAPWFEIR